MTVSIFATKPETYSIRRTSFSVLLPLASVLVWMHMVALPTAIQYAQMFRYAKGGDTAHFSAGRGHYAIPRDMWLSFSAERALTGSAKVLSAVNLPGCIFIPLIDWAKSADGPSWRPEGMPWPVWMAIILPIGCIPFWALAGLSVDGLLRQRRLRWPWLLTGSVLSVLFLIGTCACIFGVSAEDRADMGAFICGFVFWTALLALFPAVWIRMGLDRRQLRRQSNTLQR